MKKHIHRLLIFLSISLYLLVLSQIYFSCENKGHESDSKSEAMAASTNPCTKMYEVPVDADLSIFGEPHMLDITDTIGTISQIIDTACWKTFIALNWPALQNGAPDSSFCLGGFSPSLRVWERWTEISDLFPDSKGYLIAKANLDEDTMAAKPLILYEESLKKKIGTNPFRKGHIRDVNNRPTFFQIYYNDVMVNYIREMSLTNLDGQRKFAATWPQYSGFLGLELKRGDSVTPRKIEQVFFPIDVERTKLADVQGEDTVFSYLSSGNNVRGAIMIKVAWKVMDKAKDDTSNFYVRNAIIVDTLGNMNEAKVGLVAMHIAHKTAKASKWVWCTFEHKDNVPDHNAGPESGRRYNYYDKKTSPAACAVNIDCPSGNHQIMRVRPVNKTTQALNDNMTQTLSRMGSVLGNYILVGSQWSWNTEPFSGYPGDMRPGQYLANSVFESFIQDTASCMGCHAKAYIGDKPARGLIQRNGQADRAHFGDYVWGLSRAYENQELYNRLKSNNFK